MICYSHTGKDISCMQIILNVFYLILRWTTALAHVHVLTEVQLSSTKHGYLLSSIFYYGLSLQTRRYFFVIFR